MVDSGDEFFYKNVIDTLSDEESDDDLLTAAALLIHEHNVAQILVYRGSVKGRAAALDRKREAGYVQLFGDYFHRTRAFHEEAPSDLLTTSTFFFNVFARAAFRHQKGTHNVFGVNETGYNNCTMDGIAGNWTSGKDFIPLKEPRRYFFICGHGLCQAGMKVVITVYSTPGNATGISNATEFHHGPEIDPDCSPDCGAAATSTARLMVTALTVAIAAVA
ncbi:hypothetical protein ACQ4PT_045246 [Festuca glaucescens]